MTTTGGSMPAGWFPDPVGRHEYRYWDGANWTAQVSDGGVVGSDPLGPPSVPQTAQPWGTPPAAGGGSSPAKWVALGIGLLVLIGIGAFFLLRGDDDEDTATEDTATQDTVELGTGDVQVTLRWDTGDDIDLHVIDPDGFEIYFAERESPSGGELDVDQIPNCVEEGEHVENVFWPDGEAPTGEYEVFLENFTDCDDDPTTANVQVLVQGEVVVDEDVTLGEDEESEHFTFEA